MGEFPEGMNDPLLDTYHVSDTALDPTEIKAHRRRYVRNRQEEKVGATTCL